MVTGLSGVQFGLWSCEWLTKSDDCEAGVQFVNNKTISMITDWIGWHNVLLPINHYRFPQKQKFQK